MKEFYRRHLPHWQPQNAIFFVTFRLKNSLPDAVIESLREEQERAEHALDKRNRIILKNTVTLGDGTLILIRQNLVRVGSHNLELGTS
jgi:hypothetical protein